MSLGSGRVGDGGRRQSGGGRRKRKKPAGCPSGGGKGQKGKIQKLRGMSESLQKTGEESLKALRTTRIKRALLFEGGEIAPGRRGAKEIEKRRGRWAE